MKQLSDASVLRLRALVERPETGERYEIREELGRGGMGVVYRALDRTLGRLVALKVLSLPSDQAEFAERLRREARVLASLEHPGIVAVHDAGQLGDGRPFYVMRLVDGRRLDEFAVQSGRGELLRVFLRVCDAVAYAHSRGVVHRDLTPANVMVGEFGDVLVLDWGVAKVAEDVSRTSDSPASADGSTTSDGTVVGTPGFMAPEQALGDVQSTDARSDVYGLGAMLRHLLSLGAQPPPAPLRSVVARATAREPGERYPGAEELATDVRRWLDGERVFAHRERVHERIARIYRRHQALILLLFGYALVRVLILLWRGV